MKSWKDEVILPADKGNEEDYNMKVREDTSTYCKLPKIASGRHIGRSASILGRSSASRLSLRR